MGIVLVICIGNVARGDDGVAHTVALTVRERVRTSEGSHVEIVTATGLDIAMAADVATAERLVLVDAERRDAPPVTTAPILPGPPGGPTGHAIDAPALLSLAAALYGAAPPATLVSVAAPEMGHAEGLSATAEAASIEAASVVLSLLSQGAR